MEADDRRPPDPVSDPQNPAAAEDALGQLFERVAAEPYRFDLMQLLRRIECLRPDLPRLGQAQRPQEEPVRLSQEAALTFAPSTVTRVRRGRRSGRVWILQRAFGLLGPNGPLPFHLSEYAEERERHFGDLAFVSFLDMLTHRMALMFYRAWAQAQPVLGQDRPGGNPHAVYVGALCGEAGLTGRSVGPVGEDVRLGFAGRLAQAVRSADGLASWIAGYIGSAVTVEQFVEHWMPIGSAGLTRIGAPGRGPGANAGLGLGATLGSRVRDAQHKFRIVVGPLDAARYASFLPGGTGLEALRALVTRYIGVELDWDVRVLLVAADVPRLALTGPVGPAAPPRQAIARLGFGTWLGQRADTSPAADLLLTPAG